VRASRSAASLVRPTSILERLLETPATATELAEHLPVTRSAVSQHLQLMKSVGLVDDTPAGTRRVYRADPGALALLRSYFDAFWNRSLEGFRRAAEMPTPLEGAP
jgi:DNA-binding transcriptional ArsR family regulator